MHSQTPNSSPGQKKLNFIVQSKKYWEKKKKKKEKPSFQHREHLEVEPPKSRIAFSHLSLS
jgi:hypothetical protein